MEPADTILFFATPIRIPTAARRIEVAHDLSAVGFVV
jgi:hypothetical protein